MAAPKLRAEIAGCDLLVLDRWPGRRVTVVQAGTVPEVDILVNRLVQRELIVKQRKPGTAIDWEDADAVGHSLTAGDVQGLIVQALQEGLS